MNKPLLGNNDDGFNLYLTSQFYIFESQDQIKQKVNTLYHILELWLMIKVKELIFH